MPINNNNEGIYHKHLSDLCVKLSEKVLSRTEIIDH